MVEVVEIDEEAQVVYVVEREAFDAVGEELPRQ
jgi:hypothetical protein